MFTQSTIVKLRFMILTICMVMVNCAVYAEKIQQIAPMLSALSDGPNNSEISRSIPNSFVAIDFSIQAAESWDNRNSSVNQVFNCINGQFITGFEFTNVTIETFAGSFFSESVIYFTDSNQDDDGIRFIVGANNPNAGIGTFNSSGIIDITDLGLNDIASQNDGQFFMQFYEETDDISGVIDARYTNGILKVWGIDLTPVEGCPFIEAAPEQPDLSVSYNVSEDTQDFVVGDFVDYDINISNQGSGLATNIMVQHELSSKLRFIQFSCTDGSTFENTESPMSVNNIEANDDLECTLETQINAFGEISNNITVQTNDDSNDSNNSAINTITGAPIVIPANNILALLLLLFVIALYARKKIIAC